MNNSMYNDTHLAKKNSGKIVNCKELAGKLRCDMQHYVEEKVKQGFPRPKLLVIQVGDDYASNVYVRNKLKACTEIGIDCNIMQFNKDITEDEILNEIKQKTITTYNPTSVLVQLPLPKHIDENKIAHNIPCHVDVDCFHVNNLGKVMTNTNTIAPCTPQGVIEILKHLNLKDLSGKHVVIVGRSNIVGKPLANMLINANATVTVCHSKTKDLKSITRQADILIVAIGQPKYITSDHIKKGVIIIDVGINRDENNKLCGDVNLNSVLHKCEYITPVPNGVGIMTTTMVAKNCIDLWQANLKGDNYEK